MKKNQVILILPLIITHVPFLPLHVPHPCGNKGGKFFVRNPLKEMSHKDSRSHASLVRMLGCCSAFTSVTFMLSFDC